jgi:hypothetical protein
MTVESAEKNAPAKNIDAPIREDTLVHSLRRESIAPVFGGAPVALSYLARIETV